MRRARFLRIVVAAALVLVWLAAGAIGGPYFGRVSEVADNDPVNFLPASAEATKVNERFTDFVGEDSVPGIAVFAAESALTDTQIAELEQLVADLAELPDITAASPLIISEDNLAGQTFISIDADAELRETVEQLRELIDSKAPDGLTHHVTGPAGLSADLALAFTGIDGILLIVALVAVLVILLVVYRSLLLPFVVLSTSVFALSVALLANWWLAKAGIIILTGQTQGILFILVIGAATDYALLYASRYAEELKSHEHTWDATKAALAGSVEPILASGGTVIAGLMMLLLSDLNSNKSLGPVAAIGIGFAMLAALTLPPAALYLLGRAAYWPRRPKFDPDHNDTKRATEGIYAAVGRWITPRPRVLWLACIVLLAIGAGFIVTLQADGVPASQFVLGKSDARDGQELIAEHFAGGAGSPANVLVAKTDLQEVANELLASPGVASVSVVCADSPAGSAPVTEDGIQAVGPPGSPAPEPTVSEGEVLLRATLNDAADSAAAEATIRELRAELAGEARFGGTTAVAIDTKDASIHDRNLIIPLVLLVIFVILIFLLRSLVAPLILIITTVLSFGTAMGTAALVFNHLFKFPGADPSVPLYGFVFLVALGIDYNIFLMTRVREEAMLHGTRRGIIHGLALTGGVITSAGIVLAATFAALFVIPILFLAQLAFIVAYGVLLDTFFVRTLLVPAASYDVGPAIWWPRMLKSDKATVPPPNDPDATPPPRRAVSKQTAN